jgi:hypothetical protein
MKHEENSGRGDREAMETGCNGSDHDQQKSADGTSYNTHWKDVFRRDKFVDPEGEYGPGDHFDELPDEVVDRLYAVTNGHKYFIRTTEHGIRHAALVGLEYVVVELKPGNDWTIADCRRFKRAAKAARIGLIVATMDSWPRWRRTLRRARLAGCRTRRIRMG